MTLPEVLYCQDCHRNGRKTPATMAIPDPRNPKKADLLCDDCAAEDGVDVADCESVEAWRKMQGIVVTPAPAREDACSCGKPAGHKGRCQGARAKAPDKALAPVPNRAAVPKVEKAAGNGNGHLDVGGFRVRVLSLDEYRATGMREHLTDLDPIVNYVRKCEAGKVTLWDVPKGKSVKSFRERLGRALQSVAKLPVRIEIRTKENAVAVIREAR